MGIIQKQGTQNTIILYAGSALGFLNKVLLFPMLLNIEQVGLVNVLLSIAVLYAQISGFGIFNTIVKFFPKYGEGSKSKFLKLIVIWATLGFMTTTSIFYLFEDFFIKNLEKAALLTTHFHLILPLSLFILLFEVFDAYTKALFKTVFASILKDVFNRVLLLITLLLYFFQVIDFNEFLLAFIASYALTFLLLIFYLWKEQAINLTIKEEQQIDKKEMIKFGAYVFFAESSMLLVSSIDAFMLSSYKGLVDTGIYTTMGFLVSAFLIPNRALARIAGPLVAKLWTDNNRLGVSQLYSQYSKTIFFISAALYLFICVNFSTLLYFLPAEYEQGKYVFLILGFARLVDAFYGLNGVVLVTSNKYKMDLVFTIILVVITVLTNLYFIPKYGLQGAVFASAVCIIFINVIRGLYLKLAFHFSLLNKKSIALLFNFLFFFSTSTLVFQIIDNQLLALTFGNLLVLLFVFVAYRQKASPEINAWIHKRVKLAK